MTQIDLLLEFTRLVATYLQSSSSDPSSFGFLAFSSSSPSSASSSACLFLPPLPPFFDFGVSVASSSASAVFPFLLLPLKPAVAFLNLARRWVTAFGVQSVAKRMEVSNRVYRCH